MVRPLAGKAHRGDGYGLVVVVLGFGLVEEVVELDVEELDELEELGATELELDDELDEELVELALAVPRKN